MSQPYVDGVTGTVTHNLASSLTAAQITPSRDTISISVVCPDRWFLGDYAVVTMRDGRGFVPTADTVVEALPWALDRAHREAQP